MADMTGQLQTELEIAYKRIAELEQIATYYHQAQVDLNAAIEKYQALFDFAGDSIFLVDLMTLKILDANANAARRLGYSRDEILQLTIGDIEVMPEESDAMFSESSISGTRTYECHYRHKNGQLTPVEVSTRIISVGGKQIFQNFVRDITKRKALETERERLIEELDAFAHTVAHDLKNPLATIMGYANLVQVDLEDLASPEDQGFLEEIVRGTDHMRRIIDELLILASVRQQQGVNLHPINMHSIIQAALQRLQNLVKTYQPEIILPAEAEWLCALGYAPWVEEIWANYLSNAMKYGGTPPVLQLGCTREAGAIRFWIQDNGQGIPPEKRSQLFSQFNRLDQTRAEGHGLGLSIVQRIVQRLGGQVEVESVVGEGSIFSFTLPAATC